MLWAVLFPLCDFKGWVCFEEKHLGLSTVSGRAWWRSVDVESRWGALCLLMGTGFSQDTTWMDGWGSLRTSALLCFLTPGNL